MSEDDRSLRQESKSASRRSEMMAFAVENGWWLLIQKVVGGGFRRLRDTFLERKLGTKGFRIGRSPRLLGLGHCRIGLNFSAGNDLWLHAVTSHAGEQLHPSLTIGDDCNLSDHVHIGCANEVTIGSGLLCGSRVLIIDHAHGTYGAGPGIDSAPGVRPNLRPLSVTGSVSIGKNVWIGDGAAILPGARIGDGAVIGANSVVRGEVPAATMAAGVPARILRRWESETATWVRLLDSTAPANET